MKDNAQAQRMKRYRERLKRENRCHSCRRKIKNGNYQNCTKCRATIICKRSRESRQRRLNSSDMCLQCGRRKRVKGVDGSRLELCHTCREAYCNYAKSRYAQRKKERYGKRCVVTKCRRKPKAHREGGFHTMCEQCLDKKRKH